VPGKPRAVTASARPTRGATGALRVSFGAPLRTGGGPIVRYTATCRSTNGGATRSASRSGASTAPIAVRGLKTAKTYRCTVTATNGNGVGLRSTASGRVVVGAPAPPTKTRAVKVAGGQLRVSFTRAANNGAKITRFTARCVPSSGGITKTKTASSGPIRLTGLSAGKAYRCTVFATNKRGAGPPSKPSAKVKA
jgi:hypothetical protein